MGHVKSLASLAFIAACIAVSVIVAHACKKTEMVQDAYLPSPHMTEDPENRKMLGMTVEELAAAISGPGYDIRNTVEMP